MPAPQSSKAAYVQVVYATACKKKAASCQFREVIYLRSAQLHVGCVNFPAKELIEGRVPC